MTLNQVRKFALSLTGVTEAMRATRTPGLREIVAAVFLSSLGACNEDSLRADSPDITVFESRGAQCEPGITPQQSGLKLIQQGLDVKRSGCGVMRNVAFPAVCGAPSGQILLHTIPSVSSDAAERIGFKSVETLSSGYDWVDCETGRVVP